MLSSLLTKVLLFFCLCSVHLISSFSLNHNQVLNQLKDRSLQVRVRRQVSQGLLSFDGQKLMPVTILRPDGFDNRQDSDSDSDSESSGFGSGARERARKIFQRARDAGSRTIGTIRETSSRTIGTIRDAGSRTIGSIRDGTTNLWEGMRDRFEDLFGLGE